MNRCKECNFPLDENLTACPQCGAVIDWANEDNRIDSGKDPASDQTVGFADTIDLSEGINLTDDAAQFDPLAAEETESDEIDVAVRNAGTGTVSAPGMEADNAAIRLDAFDYGDDDEDDEDDISQTIDAGLTELDEADDFEFDDDFPGVQSDLRLGTDSVDTLFAANTEQPADGIGSGSGQGFLGRDQETLDAPDRATHSPVEGNAGDSVATVSASGLPESDQASESHATHMARSEVLDSDGQLTINVAGDDLTARSESLEHATIDATGLGSVDDAAQDEFSTHFEEGGTTSKPSANSADGDETSTVVMPDAGRDENAGEKTIVYQSTGTENSTLETSGASGTEGRLKRLWEGVAGSSENPMHSLQAIGLQASDSVFERVATRRVADASTAEDLAADYQIVDKLGEGAMGIVFSAKQTAVNRIVAIKTAKPSFQANDDSRRRFLYEAHITADLDHSNIVPIHELAASEEGMLFYSMKLVQGTEWSRAMRKKTREQNLEIFVKVTDAMAFAHSKGVIHRDLKPENTMLGRFGEVFVTDWGTAINLDKDTTYLAQPAVKGDKFMMVEDASNFLRGDSIVLHDGNEAFDRVQIVSTDPLNPNRLYLRKKLTRDYQPSRQLRVMKAMNLAGTPCYMAPEMAGHQLAKIGKTSDIYILGAILYDIVTGKPPHTGDSVTQCLRAALRNDIVVPQNDDALLAIAYKAMTTEPQGRYQSVEELQDAVREYRRHAESIALTQRSDDLLIKAIEKKDYEAFSRTLFGYRDAIELWPENKSASSGLKRARLAFGEVAFAKGDFDLALQTLDRQVAEEAVLYERAVAAKKKAEGRESTLKLLQRVVAAVVLFAVVGLSALSAYAFMQSALAIAARNEAVTEKERAEAAEVIATNAAASEKVAKEEAVEEKEKAESARQIAIAAQETATVAAESERVAKLDAQQSEVAARNAEAVAKQSAESERLAKITAVEAAELAKRRSAQIQLGEYNSSLALAKSQIESFDLTAGKENLDRLESLFTAEPSEDVFFGNGPKIDTWAWQRIELLGNFDLTKARISSAMGGEPGRDQRGTGELPQIETQVTVSAYSPQANIAVVGTRDGLVQLIQYNDSELFTSKHVREEGARIDAIAISPDGGEVVYGFTRAGVSGVKRWSTDQPTTQIVESTQRRPFHYFSYTTDGKQVVAGISGGIWIWERSDDWYSRPEPTKRIDGIRGKLQSLQGIGPQQTLFTTTFDEKLLLGVIDHPSASVSLIDVDQDMLLSCAAHTLVDNRIMLGLTDNRLLVGTLAVEDRQVTDLVELENKHRAPITRIVSDGQDQLVTASNNEPVAHVWRLEKDDLEWVYDTYLTGTPKNIAGVGLLGNSRVLAVDQSGTAIAWDVQRQKQRRRLERNLEGNDQPYFAAVQAVVAGPSDAGAIAINADGVVDLWSLVDGTTQRVDSQRWSYVGHTPGAELVDTAVDLKQDIVVTAASLQPAKKEYLQDPSHAWEFCVWDLTSGEMKRRWSAPQRELTENRRESIEQRISLVDSGQQMLLASDSETRVVDIESGRETFQRNDFGTYFALPNPRNPSLLMLVKRSGSVRLLDLQNESSWDAPELRNFALADPSDIPLQGVWSEDGQRFYLSFSTGGLAAFQWSGNQLELTWSTRSLKEQTQGREISNALVVTNGRIKSHLDMDLAIVCAAGVDMLHIATRNRGASTTTKLTSVQFEIDNSNVSIVRTKTEDGVRWLVAEADLPPRLTTEIHDVLVVDNSRVRSRVRMDNKSFVSTVSAKVLALVDGRELFTTYGHTKLKDSTGSLDGRVLFTLLEDGSIWKFSVGDQGASWSRMVYADIRATDIYLAPDGNQLLVLAEGQGKLMDAETGVEVKQIGPVRFAAWEQKLAGRLAVMRPFGEFEIFDGNESRILPKSTSYSQSEQIRGLSFFNEVWSSGQAPRQFLTLHTESSLAGFVEFLPIDPAPLNATDDEPARQEVAFGTHLAVSPTENILVTGADSGTVAVWFATPTFDRLPKQLFDLEGHRGAPISCLAFSSDGRTIITADSKNRLFAWLSSDPLQNKELEKQTPLLESQ